ncbi:MAG: hypothetical protein ABFS37_15910 [Acidobacteriota bacterium]
MNRQKGISTLGSILLAAVAGLGAATVLMDWVIVDVQTPEPEAIHIKAPFPLVIADIAVAFIPEDVTQDMEVPPEARAQREAVMAALSSLVDAPDGALVEVTTPDETVSIVKKGRKILVDVDAEDAVVHCSVPLDGIYKCLERWDWEIFEPKMVLTALHHTSPGVLVDVHADDGTKVKVTKW